MRDWHRELRQQSAFDYGYYRGVTPILLLFFFMAASFVHAHALLEVQWKNNHLSVTAEETPLAQILKEVSHQTNVEIRGLETLQEETSVHFVDLALNDALRMLLVHV